MRVRLLLVAVPTKPQLEQRSCCHCRMTFAEHDCLAMPLLTTASRLLPGSDLKSRRPSLPNLLLSSSSLSNHEPSSLHAHIHILLPVFVV